MSHYSVAVFHRKNQTVEDLLAPYSENIDVEPYILYSRQDAISYARKHFDVEDLNDDECWKMMAEDSKTDADGNIYSTYNPLSKWDSWIIGGRWSNMLNIRGKCVDTGRVGDMTFQPDMNTYENALHFWDIAIDHKEPDPNGDYLLSHSEAYYRDRYKDRETFAKYTSQFSTYAVITPDGNWHAPGLMGYFGYSSETADEAREWFDRYKERFIDTADPDWELTVVDCHI